jgi:hypothetical protein
MLASVLIPSRNRFDKLLNCIRSVYGAASYVNRFEDFEVIVRFHNDDRSSLMRAYEIDREFGDKVRVITGETFKGYESLSVFTQELIDAAKGDWVWHVNDDMVVTGNGWNVRLAEIPLTGVLVQPEIHQLNESVYPNDLAGPAPIHPRTALGDLLTREHRYDVDMIIYNELVEKRGWKVEFLHSIGVWHQWDGAHHFA